MVNLDLDFLEANPNPNVDVRRMGGKPLKELWRIGDGACSPDFCGLFSLPIEELGDKGWAGAALPRSSVLPRTRRKSPVSNRAEGLERRGMSTLAPRGLFNMLVFGLNEDTVGSLVSS